MRRRYKLRRCAILMPSKAPWTRLYDSGDGKSLLSLLGMMRTTFQWLHSICFGQVNQHAVGRSRLLSTEGSLGLILIFLQSRMQFKHICLIFGITPSTCSRYLDVTLQHLLSAMRRHPEARVKFPNGRTMERFAAMVHRREPLVDDVIGFMDGPLLCKKISTRPRDPSVDNNLDLPTAC
jgi:hypothetical protein